MDLVIPVLTGIGLSMDCLAVSLAIGAAGAGDRFRTAITVGLFFGFFQLVMPLAGYFGGQAFMGFISSFDHFIAFGILACIGGKMIYESFSPKESISHIDDPTRRWSLIILSIATSIDAFAVGLSIAMLNYEIWFASVIIGIVAALLTALGMLFGRQLGARFGKRMELAGGVILIGIGLKILLGHMA